MLNTENYYGEYNISTFAKKTSRLIAFDYSGEESPHNAEHHAS